jgi:hypothetical protein
MIESKVLRGRDRKIAELLRSEMKRPLSLFQLWIFVICIDFDFPVDALAIFSTADLAGT